MRSNFLKAWIVANCATILNLFFICFSCHHTRTFPFSSLGSNMTWCWTHIEAWRCATLPVQEHRLPPGSSQEWHRSYELWHTSLHSTCGRTPSVSASTQNHSQHFVADSTSQSWDEFIHIADANVTYLEFVKLLQPSDHRVSTSRRKWYPPAGANEYGRRTPWLAD